MKKIKKVKLLNFFLIYFYFQKERRGKNSEINFIAEMKRSKT